MLNTIFNPESRKKIYLILFELMKMNVTSLTGITAGTFKNDDLIYPIQPWVTE